MAAANVSLSPSDRERRCAEKALCNQMQVTKNLQVNSRRKVCALVAALRISMSNFDLLFFGCERKIRRSGKK